MAATSALVQNAHDLEEELAWLQRILQQRLKSFFEPTAEIGSLLDLQPPDLSQSESQYAALLRHYQPAFGERLAIVLALVPHVRPQLLDDLAVRNPHTDRRYCEFGGVLEAPPEGGVLPTIETLAFLLGDEDLSMRFAVLRLFDPQHYFTKHDLLRLGSGGQDESLLRAPLRLSPELLSRITLGEPRRLRHGPDFPAQYIETKLSWTDVILQPSTRKSIDEIKTWIEFGPTLLKDWGMADRVRPGHRSLFHGPPGTGKTMTACLLGKSTGRDVYRVDLALVLSKYIGETEKNLGRVFDHAEHKGWILFFDEADALFGKRSATRDAHDRYANQEVAYLLQRLESFDGIAILASNLRDNIDAAFLRRFESVVHFPMPRFEERLRLWQTAMPPAVATLDPQVDLEKLAREHELSGGGIVNVIRYAALQALKEGRRDLKLDDLLVGIRKEYVKEGRSG